jgi:hypothetical protein
MPRTVESLRWGVWGSFSKENYDTLLEMDRDTKITQLPPMFSCLSTKIQEYPDTLNLKMSASVPKVNMRPHFELECTDHPLSQEYHNGIFPELVEEIMAGRLIRVE